MAHKRAQIRSAVATRLTGLATTGSNVHAGAAPRALSETAAPPALVIYTFPDTPVYDDGEGAEMGEPPKPMRMLTVEVQGYFTGGSDDDLDQIAVEVEEAVYSDETFGGLVDWVELGEQDAGRDADGAKLEGVIIMQFQFHYSAAEGSPQG